jgi:hypothetical protein
MIMNAFIHVGNITHSEPPQFTTHSEPPQFTTHSEPPQFTTHK